MCVLNLCLGVKNSVARSVRQSFMPRGLLRKKDSGLQLTQEETYRQLRKRISQDYVVKKRDSSGKSDDVRNVEQAVNVCMLFLRSRSGKVDNIHQII